MEIIEKMWEAAAYLDDHDNLLVLKNLSKILKNRICFLSFLGQFSAGKSRLINCILDRDILPVRTTETTAAVTFIKHAEDEVIKIYTIHGNVIIKEIEMLKLIYQNSDNTMDINLSEIDYIEVCIKNKLLENGLVIVDTPGVNTINQRHEQLTAAVLSSAGITVYVYGKALSYTDKSFIMNLRDNSISTIFIRTKMDLLHSSEEDLKLTVKADKMKLQELIKGEPVIFHVSNERESEWHNNLNHIRTYIQTEISDQIDSRIDEICNERLRIVSKALKSRLEYMKITAEQIMSGEQKKIEDEKNKMIEFQNHLISCKEHKENELRKKVLKAKEKLKEEIIKLNNESVKSFGEKCKANKEEAEIEAISQLTIQELTKLARNIQYEYERTFNALFSAVSDNFALEAEKYGLEELINLKDVHYKTYTEFLDEQNMMNACNEQKGSMQTEIIQAGDNVSELQKNLFTANEMYEKFSEIYQQQVNETNLAKNNLTDLKPYIAQLVLSEDQPEKVSKVMKNVGFAADIISLILPGAEIEKALVEGGKYVKVMNEAAKGAELVDAVKDSLFVVKTFKDQILPPERIPVTKDGNEIVADKKEKPKKPNILDMLTFEYLFEKIGKNFDQPPRYEVDMEYEEKYNAVKKELKDKFAFEAKREVEMKQKLGLLKSEIEKNEELIKIEQKKATKLEDDLKEKKKELEDNLKKEYIIKRNNFYIILYGKKVNAISSCLIDVNNNQIDKIVPFIIEICTQNFCKEIEKVRQIIDELCIKTNNGEIVKKYALCNEYLNLCNGYLNLCNGVPA